MTTYEIEMTRQRADKYGKMMDAVENAIIAVTVFSFVLILYVMTALIDIAHY